MFLEWNYQLFPRLKNVRESMQFIVYLWVLRNFNSEAQCSIEQTFTVIRGGSRTAATSKMERFVNNSYRVPAVNYYHKALHLGCCNSPRSASGHSIAKALLTHSMSQNQFSFFALHVDLASSLSSVFHESAANLTNYILLSLGTLPYIYWWH